MVRQTCVTYAHILTCMVKHHPRCSDSKVCGAMAARLELPSNCSLIWQIHTQKELHVYYPAFLLIARCKTAQAKVQGAARLLSHIVAIGCAGGATCVCSENSPRLICKATSPRLASSLTTTFPEKSICPQCARPSAPHSPTPAMVQVSEETKKRWNEEVAQKVQCHQ